MKSTGIVRRVDELGRIVLPMELRRTFGIDLRDSMEIYTDNDMIILRKFNDRCVFCGNTEDLREYKDKHVCAECARELGATVTSENG